MPENLCQVRHNRLPVCPRKQTSPMGQQMIVGGLIERDQVASR
jgi:hypothetical protein